MNNLKELREKANLTQESLAKLINVDRSTIAKWETGEASPRSDKLPTLAYASHSVFCFFTVDLVFCQRCFFFFRVAYICQQKNI